MYQARTREFNVHREKKYEIAINNEHTRQDFLDDAESVDNLLKFHQYCVRRFKDVREIH